MATIARPAHAWGRTAEVRPDLRAVADDAGVDLARAERAVVELLAALGQDPSSEHLLDTPRRVAASYADRGVHAAGTRTVTSTLHGLLRDDPRSRQEFLALTGATIQ